MTTSLTHQLVTLATTTKSHFTEKSNLCRKKGGWGVGRGEREENLNYPGWNCENYPEIKILAFSRGECSGANGYSNNPYFAFFLQKPEPVLAIQECVPTLS